jgi:hypothetical protein
VGSIEGGDFAAKASARLIVLSTANCGGGTVDGDEDMFEHDFSL